MSGRKEVYVDGACINNGQPHRAQAGIGVYWGPNNPNNVSEPVKGPPTNTAAELQAAARAISDAGKVGTKSLRVFTDSETVRTAKDIIQKRKENSYQKYNEHKNQWKRASGDRPNFELLENAIERYPTMNVEFVHVRGHSGNQHNMGADRLAKEGAKQYRTGYY